MVDKDAKLVLLDIIIFLTFLINQNEIYKINSKLKSTYLTIKTQKKIL